MDREPDLSTYRESASEALLRKLILHQFPGRIAVASSFGTESAVLLKIIAGIDPRTPVLFIDTRKLFEETLRYKDELVRLLGLTDVRIIGPSAQAIRRHDPCSTLWEKDHEACCAFRKVSPLREALLSFDAWINGRKQYHGGERERLADVEEVGGKTKVNPLATWTAEEIEEAFTRHGLPRHPLADQGYPSLLCIPCTKPVDLDSIDPRSGRKKKECGIHTALAGNIEPES